MPTPQPAIRPMKPADVAPASLAIIRGDWGDRSVFLEFAVRHPECDPLVADLDGEIVGTALGTRNGPIGWVGVIYVVPERRGSGLGRALTQAVCDRLEAAGCRTLALVATEAGQRLYGKLGFSTASHYRILQAPGLRGSDSPDGVRAFDPPLDLAEASVLDREATGEDRAHLLAALGGSSGSLAVRDAGGRLRAYVVRPPWGRGATVAADPEWAEQLLESRRRRAGLARHVRAGLLAENRAGLRRLRELGWQDAWSAVRMERGPAVQTRAEMIYGQFNFALG